MNSYLTIIHALSALHAGTGQGSGIIDLPVAREKATGLPYLPGSSLKGALKTACPLEFEVLVGNSGKRGIKREQIFGSEQVDSVNTSAGTIQFSDQRLLLLPVRSLAGTFAWVTSPYILLRLRRNLLDLKLIDAEALTVPQIAEKESKSALVTETKDQISCKLFAHKEKIYLEDLDLVASQDPRASAWAQWLGKQIFAGEDEWQNMLRERFCLVHDDILSFLLETATEIVARIRLEESSKTVSQGALWYEEALPAETILSGLGLTTPRSPVDNGRRGGQEELNAEELGAAFRHIANKNLQLGGKSTVGRGQCRIRAVEGAR